MRRRVGTILIVAALIIALAVGGALLYRRFVTNRIVDKDGMENPDYTGQQEERLPDETGSTED